MRARAAADARANAEFVRDIARSRRVADTAPALQAIASHSAGPPGRISLVWIVSHLPLSGTEVEALFARDGVAVHPVDARGLMAREGPSTDGVAPNPPGAAPLLHLSDAEVEEPSRRRQALP